MKNIPIISYIARYYKLLLCVAVFVFLALNDKVFREAGTLAYIPVLIFEVMAVVVFMRHIFNPKSSDEDARTGKFDLEWDLLDPKTRVILTIVQFLGYFIGACILISGLVR